MGTKLISVSKYRRSCRVKSQTYKQEMTTLLILPLYFLFCFRRISMCLRLRRLIEWPPIIQRLKHDFKRSGQVQVKYVTIIVLFHILATNFLRTGGSVESPSSLLVSCVCTHYTNTAKSDKVVEYFVTTGLSSICVSLVIRN